MGWLNYVFVSSKQHYSRSLAPSNKPETNPLISFSRAPNLPSGSFGGDSTTRRYRLNLCRSDTRNPLSIPVPVSRTNAGQQIVSARIEFITNTTDRIRILAERRFCLQLTHDQQHSAKLFIDKRTVGEFVCRHSFDIPNEITCIASLWCYSKR